MKAILEKITAPPGAPFYTREFALPVFDCPYHYHPEYELTQILQSNGTRITGDAVRSFHAGDLVLHGPNLPHIYSNVASESRGDTWASARVLQFTSDFLGTKLLECPEMDSIRLLFQRSGRGLHFNSHTTSLVAPLFAAIIHASGPHRIILLLQILQILSQSSDPIPLASPQYAVPGFYYDDQRIERICTYLLQHYRQPITQQQVAQIVHMSAPAFSRYFHRMTRKTFSAFLRELRLGHSCQLLRNSHKSILEICHASGFSNLSNFNRCFLQQNGLTPRAYRHQFQSVHPPQ